MVWKLKPSERVESAQDANLAAQMEETSVDTSAPIAEDVPQTLPEPSAEAKALEAAIRSGDRYRVASALASMGVRTDDELLNHILLPPFGDEPAR